MKVVNLEQFLMLPYGTVFSKFQPMCFEELEFKTDNAGRIDYRSVRLTAAIEEEHRDLLDETDLQASVPMDFGIETRDASFDESQLFAVWERSDIEGLRERLLWCLERAYPL